MDTPPSVNALLPAPLALSADRLERFYDAVAAMFDAWVRRRPSLHTQRAYRTDVLSFVRFLGLQWPAQSHHLLGVSVPQVQNYRDWMQQRGVAPKTLNRRIASLSSFYRYLAGCAAELRIPVALPNPAHAQFIPRGAADPLQETPALTAAGARRLLELPQGSSLEAVRDRAILRLYLYSGMRLATGIRLHVEDFQPDGAPSAILRLREKGARVRTIGLHETAAQALGEYLGAAQLQAGPLFRPFASPRKDRLAERPMGLVTMYGLLRAYLDQLPGAAQRRFTPHSLRATTATLLLEAGVDIVKVQELLGHRHITTTQIYDKRRRSAAEGASHQVPL